MIKNKVVTAFIHVFIYGDGRLREKCSNSDEMRKSIRKCHDFWEGLLRKTHEF